MIDLFEPHAEPQPSPGLLIDIGGMCSGARYLPSPNQDQRPEDCLITLLVVHNISLPPDEFGGAGIIELFTNCLDPGAHPYFATICNLKVSAHFLIRRDGELVQFVPCERRAWHAGESAWKGRERCNDFSVGVELEGADHIPYTDAQYLRLTDLTLALRDRYGSLDIVGHSDVAPARKTDPGPAFDWRRFLCGLL